ncbi:Gfo/Idh/MocA family oxidoreductase [Pedobacter gandavensis]|uniref:Gfo/Idh/MocA family protein n=1 Tax=Pedobacter gandavensis TaxID=2679963 RepID=UPI00292E49BF|nr:Gfo/Idh/MocA family oxidoreductase [Pedobacter gandavensis]
MESIKWGMIGCGDVTEVKSGPAFNKVPNSSLVAVMRRDGVKARDYAARHGVPKWYTDAQALIDDPEVNAIYIATPPAQHEAYTLMAFEAGKPVYVEKPMTLNAASAIRMNEAALDKDMKLSIAHYRRAQPMFLKIKALLEDQEIGAIRLVQLKMFQTAHVNPLADASENWRLNPSISGGGLFHDLAPHQLDLMIFFFGEWKTASGLSRNQSGIGMADDLVTGQIAFKNGIVFNGSWCFSVAEQDCSDQCEIFGSLGKISFQVFGHQIRVTKGGIAKVYDFSPLPHVQQPMIEQVTAYFLGKSPNPCSAAEAILSMQLMDRFTEQD